MPLTEYEQALVGLVADSKRAVEDVFVAWSADAGLVQVVQNITGETALTTVDFTSLLNSFAVQIASGNSPMDSWLAACRAHKMKGRLIADAQCPVILGRAKGLEDHAVSVARTSSGSLTSAEAKRLLLKYSGALNVLGFEPFLREAPIGKFNLVWATFDSANPDASPFDRLPITHVGICAALGLGDLTDTLIILVWNHADSGSPPLHRPTIADAEAHRYYRPNPDANAPWGLTVPLSPNPGGFQPQPEVVMPDPTSRGLQLPFSVVHA